MGWLKPATKIPPQWDAMFMRKLVERIRTALNFIDEGNFPNGISGTVVKDNTLDVTKLSGLHFTIPIVALGTGFTTTSTSLVAVGGAVPWVFSAWQDTVQLSLFVTGGSSHASAIATYELHGVDGLLASCTIQSATYTTAQSALIDAPIADQNLVLKIKTDNGSYAAGITNALLLIVPKV